MNHLFEAYVAALLRAALSPLGYEVVAQGGLRHCLLEIDPDGSKVWPLFQTRPDCLVRKDGKTILVLDTKWKRLVPRARDPKRGISQSDVYQMMAYGQLYDCPDLMLLQPYSPDLESRGTVGRHLINVDGIDQRLVIAAMDVAADRLSTIAALKDLVVSTGFAPNVATRWQLTNLPNAQAKKDQQ